MSETAYTHRLQAFPRITTDPKRTALAMFVVWGIADTLSTWAMTAVHGPGYEWNIFMTWLIWVDPALFVLLKVVGSALIAAFIWTQRMTLWRNSLWVPVAEILLLMGVIAAIANTLAALGVI